MTGLFGKKDVQCAKNKMHECGCVLLNIYRKIKFFQIIFEKQNIVFVFLSEKDKKII